MRRLKPIVAGMLCASAALAAPPEPFVIQGSGLGVSASTIGARLATVPPFQLAEFDPDPAKARRAFVDSVLVPELLYAKEAEAKKLDQQPAVQDRIREALRQAMSEALRAETLVKKPVMPEDVRAYFEANKSRFNTPRRIRIWRILVSDEALAKKIIAESKGTEGPLRWSAFAREHSLDKATNLRDGDLGFVRADGSTDTPRVRVNAALFAAVDPLAEGEILAEPLRDGSNFAVLWRRGSMPGVERTLEQEEASIRQVLERERLEKAQSELLASLKTQHVSAVQENLLEYVTVDGFGDVAARKRPGVVPRRPEAGAKPPAPGERGNR
jgi:peptidyl-prolyl cis-trans isomerase C